jgi:hypothetical protein
MVISVSILTKKILFFYLKLGKTVKFSHLANSFHKMNILFNAKPRTADLQIVIKSMIKSKIIGMSNWPCFIMLIIRH